MTKASVPHPSPSATRSGEAGRPRVVVGVDCSLESQRVLGKAADVARLLDADLEAVFVYYPAIFGVWTWPIGASETDMHQHMFGLLSQVVRAAFGNDSRPGLSVQAIKGDPTETLVSSSSGCEMLIVGGSGDSAVLNLLLGSVAAKCVEHASVPVLVVHPGGGAEQVPERSPEQRTAKAHPDTESARQSAGRIVVGVDGSAESKAALRWAARLATVMGIGIDAVTIWEVPVYYGGFGPGYMPPHWEPQTDYTRYLNEYVDDVFGDQRPGDLRLFAEEGHAARRLLAHAERAAILIVGNRGRGGFASLLLGSVSASCANRATCPVLVVHLPRAGRRETEDPAVVTAGSS